VYAVSKKYKAPAYMSLLTNPVSELSLDIHPIEFLLWAG